MDWPLSRSRWRKRSQRGKPSNLLLATASLFLVLFILFFLSSSSNLFRSLAPAGTLDPLPQRCPSAAAAAGELSGERFLWYAPHSGFSNQLSELKNALLFAAILNRTLIVPPVLDHHAVALGSCPKFRVTDPSELRAAVWDHIMDLIRSRRYISMADIVDLSSSVTSMVKTIDFRVFVSVWCGLNVEPTCFGSLCCALSSVRSLSSDLKQCRSLLTGLKSKSDMCTYAVREDCRTTVWTYQQDTDDVLDAFQPDKELQRKKKISYVRKRRDIHKAFGPGSKAESATVLSFGSLFSSPYKGSELYIDMHESPRDDRMQSLMKKISFLPFALEILDAGREFALDKIKEPFLCAQLRLLDGQFKNHWKATFSALEQKLQSLQTTAPVHIFIMTDLPRANWTGTYLADLTADTSAYRLYTLEESDEFIAQTAKRLVEAEHGLRSGFLPRSLSGIKKNSDCEHALLPDILLYVEESVCSCAALGFVGTVGSTIAGSIELMRQNKVCKL